MRNCCFALLKDYLYETVVLNETRHNINVKLLRQWFISAEFTKAATEESIFRGKKGALFTLALFGAKVKAIAA